MGVSSDAAVSPGAFVRQLDDVKGDVAQTRTARRGEATSIGARGMRFHSGGGATFEDGGGITIRDGGAFVVEDGGLLSAEYPSGRPAVKFGPLTDAVTGTASGHGLLVQADDDSQGRDVFRAKYEDGERLVFIGQSPGSDASGAVDHFTADAVRVAIHSHGNELRLQSHHGGDIAIVGGESTTGPSDILLWTPGGGDITVQTSAGGNMSLVSDGDVDIDAVGHAFVTGTGQMAIGGGAGTFIQPEATGLAANVHMAADGRVYRSTSSIRYKTDIRDLDLPADAALGLRARSWLPKPAAPTCPEWLHARHGDDGTCPALQEPEPPDPDGERVVGFIAEELVAAGLSAFVEFVDGQPESIRYDRLTAALVPLLQAQQQQITDLTARLDALESTTTAGP